MSNIPPPPPIGGRPEDNNEDVPSEYTPPPPPPVSAEPPVAQPTPPAPPPPPPPPMPPVNVQPTGTPANIGTGPTQVKKTNAGLVSLILGIVGICGITAIVGLVFGIVALRQANKEEGKGKTLAIVGIVLNAAWLVLLVIFGIIGDS